MSSHGGDLNLDGSLFGFVVAALMFWIAVGILPFCAPVAAWFQRRLKSDPLLPSLGRMAAAKDMTPGQIVLFSVSSIVITTVILLNIVPQIVAITNHAGSPGLGAVALVFAGPAMIVSGSIIAILSAARRRRALITAGVLLTVVGLASVISGSAIVLASTS